MIFNLIEMMFNLIEMIFNLIEMIFNLIDGDSPKSATPAEKVFAPTDSQARKATNYNPNPAAAGPMHGYSIDRRQPQPLCSIAIKLAQTGSRNGINTRIGN
jgi:hypothetical protein